MELLERDLYFDVLSKKYNNAIAGDGNVVFLAGEAGVGKTSLINQFLKCIDQSTTLLLGACDSFFTPRPLGPLYDISGQLSEGFLAVLKEEEDRALIFASFIQRLTELRTPTVIVIEDIHWADEATIDFIKFLGRRISRLACLLLLTYRDDEIHNRHPLKSVFGELQADVYTKLLINRLSFEAVNNLAIAKGHENGGAVYQLTGGNPFYVNEILASYSLGIPERVKDSVVSVFRAMNEKTRGLWEFLSIFPSGIDLMMVEKLDIDFPNGIENCIRTSVIIDHRDHFTFKHELFRLAIEESLSSHKRKAFHSRVLGILLENATGDLSKIVHHAKFAGEEKIVAEYAVLAAAQAAAIGSHLEAARLYRTAIEYKENGYNESEEIELHEKHAHECYLSGQFEAAIESLARVLSLARTEHDHARVADTLRLLSRLYFLKDDLHRAVSLGEECATEFEVLPSTKGKAKAYSNLAQLYLVSEEFNNASLWGQKAIGLAKEIDDKHALVHGLTSVGTAEMRSGPFETGIQNLRRAIDLARKHRLVKHAVRSYGNLFEALVDMRLHSQAEEVYHESLKYCNDHDLGSSTHALTYSRAVMLFNIGHWSEAEELANKLQSSNQSRVKIGAINILARIEGRRGNFENAKLLLNRLRDLVSALPDVRYAASLLTAELEFQWIRGESSRNDDNEQRITSLFAGKKSWHLRELYPWVQRVGLEIKHEYIPPDQFLFELSGNWKKITAAWRELGSPYEEALALLDGDEPAKKLSLAILDQLNAAAVYKKVQLRLKSEGAKSIPRGLRNSTRNHPVHLTIRQVEVLRMLKHGLQNNEIADKLFVTPKTVEQHVTAILSKLEVSTRAKAVVEAQKRGLL